ncbi:MAG: hypothetical protein DMG54_34455 [Acidobacteria bacterium]|nr:MAG: hypothetical protein DMG54_34455 [Acidobacteriota bacterium]PYU77479.1 MAG: hypothetical protein DMG52_00110 [Acidobacteriota bacterium]
MVRTLLPGTEYEVLGSQSQARMVGGRKNISSQRRRGQKIWRKGNRVGQDKDKGAYGRCSPHANQSAMVRKADRRKKKAGEESRLRNQRRTVEGSVTRSGSLRGGAALSMDLCSRKYRRRAWLRATRL